MEQMMTMTDTTDKTRSTTAGPDRVTVIAECPNCTVHAARPYDGNDCPAQWNETVYASHDMRDADIRIVTYSCTHCGHVWTPRHVAMVKVFMTETVDLTVVNELVPLHNIHELLASMFDELSDNDWVSARACLAQIQREDLWSHLSDEARLWYRTLAGIEREREGGWQ